MLGLICGVDKKVKGGKETQVTEISGRKNFLAFKVFIINVT